jgi:hypothetical protein
MTRSGSGCLVIALTLSAASAARAQPGSLDVRDVRNVHNKLTAQNEVPAKDASRHFQRGVDLYGEGDIRGALVEFKRAYALLPRATVLYNIGQAEYQLQEYASALRTLERFLTDTGPTAAHRAEVQQTVEVLRGRVGHIALDTDHDGCEVTLDDQPAGTTPLAQPLLVSIGRRKVSLSCAGWPRATRDVEVAAGQTINLDLRVGPSPGSAVAGLGSRTPDAAASETSGRRGNVAWIVTAGLGAATLGVYTAAILQSRQLGRLRRSYPISMRQLDDNARRTSQFAIAGDVLAATTVVAAGVASYLRWGTSSGRGIEVGLAPTSVSIQGRF